MQRGHRRTFRTLGILGAAAIVVAGCGGGDEVAPPDTATPAPDPNAQVVGDGMGGEQNIDPITGLPIESADLGATAEIPDLTGGDIGGGLGAINAEPIFDANAMDPNELAQQDASNEPEVDPTDTTTETTTSTEPAVTYTGAKVSIDGVVTDVELQGLFPNDNPVFRLLSVSGGNIEIELIAGEFTSGGGSGVLLDKGEEVSLVNSSEQLTYKMTYLRPIKGSDGISF